MCKNFTHTFHQKFLVHLKRHTAVEKYETTIGIFLDLSKAFDTIDHNILLYKLQYYGFCGPVLQWFKNYLNNRKQYVFHNNCKSDLKDIVVSYRDLYWDHSFLYCM